MFLCTVSVSDRKKVVGSIIRDLIMRRDLYREFSGSTTQIVKNLIKNEKLESQLFEFITK